jgi:hypothetical protein
MSGHLIKVMSQRVDPLENAGRLDFTKSYQLTRLIVGVIGVTLPLVLIVFDALIFEQFLIGGRLAPVTTPASETGSSEAFAQSVSACSPTWVPGWAVSTIG